MIGANDKPDGEQFTKFVCEELKNKKNKNIKKNKMNNWRMIDYLFDARNNFMHGKGLFFNLSKGEEGIFKSLFPGENIKTINSNKIRIEISNIMANKLIDNIFEAIEWIER